MYIIEKFGSSPNTDPDLVSGRITELRVASDTALRVIETTNPAVFSSRTTSSLANQVLQASEVVRQSSPELEQTTVNNEHQTTAIPEELSVVTNSSNSPTFLESARDQVQAALTGALIK